MVKIECIASKWASKHLCGVPFILLLMGHGKFWLDQKWPFILSALRQNGSIKCIGRRNSAGRNTSEGLTFCSVEGAPNTFSVLLIPLLSPCQKLSFYCLFLIENISRTGRARECTDLLHILRVSKIQGLVPMTRLRNSYTIFWPKSQKISEFKTKIISTF